MYALLFPPPRRLQSREGRVWRGNKLIAPAKVISKLIMSTSNAAPSTSAPRRPPTSPDVPSNSAFSAEEFFATQHAPSNLASHSRKAREFVQRHHKEGKKVVLVTVSDERPD